MSETSGTKPVRRLRTAVRHWRPSGTTTLLTIGGLVMLAPFLWMFSTSLRSAAASVTVPPQWLPTQWHPDNYTRLASDDYPVLRFLQNSVLVSLLATAGIVITSALAGYAFAKLEFRFRNALFGLLLVSLMIPIQVTIVPLYVIMGKLGLIDSPWALVVPALLGAFAPGIPGAFGIFMMRQFFRSTPDALIEAATIDGAGPIRIFFRIALPLAKPALASLTVITFILSWNDYFSPLIFLNSTDIMTLPVGIQSLRPPFGQQSSLVMAAVTVALIPVLLVFVAGQRWIVQGFTRSGLNE
ncbi:carbohydrate ABC transporter permease [Streptomyces sp. NBC_01716]|uniref:carbohydrate ABC transporter permease n=1 Tax=Streptomyces sp. NBC_01716 TaxID=2975917 RepID=UPI002E2F50A6|nr:carbohydrate ABC transporter permease [Streptomyces sp. NBC_01716]